MNSDSSASDFPNQIEHEAAAWHARRDRGFTGSEQDDFFQWLAMDPRHGEWFARHQGTVAGLRLLAQWRPEHSSRPNPDLLGVSRRSFIKTGLRWFVPITLAAAALVAVLLYTHSTTQEVHVASVEQPIVRKVLEDGSTIDLNRGAVVEVNYSPGIRNIRLVSGEATFDVAKNHARPFIVDAHGIKVRAVGTAFSVNLETKQVVVLVTEGRVLVAPAQFETSKLDSPHQAPLPASFVDAGQRISVALDNSGAPRVESVAANEMARALALQPRELEFDDIPLDRVVAEFNARNRVKMVIEDPSLAAIPVGASLRSDNVDGFVRILEMSFHVRAEHPSQDVIVLRSAD